MISRASTIARIQHRRMAEPPFRSQPPNVCGPLKEQGGKEGGSDRRERKDGETGLAAMAVSLWRGKASWLKLKIGRKLMEARSSRGCQIFAWRATRRRISMEPVKRSPFPAARRRVGFEGGGGPLNHFLREKWNFRQDTIRRSAVAVADAKRLYSSALRLFVRPLLPLRGPFAAETRRRRGCLLPPR